METGMSHRIGRSALALLLSLAPVAAPTLAQEPDESWAEEQPARTVLWVTFGHEELDEYRLGTSTETLAGDVVREWIGVGLAHDVDPDLELWLHAVYAANEADAALGVDDERGPQDLTLGARFAVHRARTDRGEWSLRLAPGAKVPLDDYETKTFTALGDGQVDLLGRALLRYQDDSGAFGVLETGYDVRLEDTPDEWPLHLTVGVPVGESATAFATYSRIESLGGDELVSIDGQTKGKGHGDGEGSFATLEQDWQALGLGLYWALSDATGLQISWTRTLDGSNTGLGDALAFTWVTGW